MLQFEYPRPQLVRDGWTSLNGQWDLAFDAARQHRGLLDAIEWTHRILVLFASEAAASGIGDQGFHPCVWYRRKLDGITAGGRTLMRFGAGEYYHSDHAFLAGRTAAEKVRAASTGASDAVQVAQSGE